MDVVGPSWRKNTRSGSSGSCVEIADNQPDIVRVRDSKDTAGPVLTFGPDAWSAFVDSVRTGLSR